MKRFHLYPDGTVYDCGDPETFYDRLENDSENFPDKKILDKEFMARCMATHKFTRFGNPLFRVEITSDSVTLDTMKEIHQKACDEAEDKYKL